MRISELIERLNGALADYGDVPVVIDNDDPEFLCEIRDCGPVYVRPDGMNMRVRDGEDGDVAYCLDLF